MKRAPLGEPIPNHPSRHSPAVCATTLSGRFLWARFSPIFARTCEDADDERVSPVRAGTPGVRVQPCRLQSEVRIFSIEFSVSPFSARPYLTRCCTRKAECNPGRLARGPRNRYGSGISRIRFFHSSASEAAQTSSSASITSATGVCCFTRNTPALEPRPQGTRRNVAALSSNRK